MRVAAISVAAMDEEWAAEVLEWWIEAAPKAQSTNGTSRHSWGRPGSDAMNALREREDETRRVVATVNGTSHLPNLLSTGPLSDVIEVATGVELCRYALGRLRRGAQTRAKLGSNAPTMAADSLHSLVWESASGRWASGHYADAVQRAASSLNEQVQFRVGRRDISDSQLMKEAFSLSAPEPGKSRLRWAGNDADQTVKSMRVGILQFAQGAFSAIRNPATHSTDDMERQEALEQLAALSILARWIEHCDVVSA